MPTTYNAGSNTYWFFTDLQGRPLAGGKIYSYRDTVRSQSKPIYQNEAGTAYPNPVTLNDNGMTPGPLYFADDENYYLVVTDSSGLSGGILYVFEAYQPPNGGGSSPVTVNQDFRDFIGDATFVYVPQTTISTLTTEQRIGQAGWYFTKNNTSATDQIEFLDFNLGDSTPPFTPKRYLRYTCSGAGSGETFKGPGYRIQGVRNLEQTQVSIALYGKSSTAANTLEIVIKQHFGTGGTPSADVETSVTTHTLTSSWAQYFTSVIPPSTSGKTLGTNGDDYMSIEFRVPLNALTEIDMTMTQLNLGNSLQPFDYLTPTINASNIIPPFNPSTMEGYILKILNGYISWREESSEFSTGDGKLTLKTSPDSGWVMADDGTIGNASSNATNRANTDTENLFTLLWNNISNTYAPIFDSAGAATTRGASAAADFAANKAISLTRQLGRSIGIAGAGSGLTSRSLGEYLGSEDKTLIEANLPAHTHRERAFVPPGGGLVNLNYFTGAGAATSWNTIYADSVTSGGSSIAPLETGSTGSGTSVDVMNPTTYWNVMIKL